MYKLPILLLYLALFAASCGQKDSIKVETQVEMLGDGEYVTQSITLPLSDKVVGTYDDSTENLQPLVRGLLRSVMDVGASLGAGKTRLSLTQRLPEEIPDVIGSLKIKRIFFLIDEKKEEGKRQKKKNKNVNFDFLEALALKLNIEKHEFDNDSWEPIITNSAVDRKERKIFDRLPDFEIFKKEDKTTLEEWNYSSDGLMFLNYRGSAPAETEKHANLVYGDSKKKNGNVYVLDTDLPLETRSFFMGRDSEFKQYIKKTVILNKTLIIEVNNDPIDESLFAELLINKADKFNYLVKKTNICTENCLDFELADFNMIPFLKRGNALKMDAYIDPGKAPPSFQLKGYIEFEIKIKAKL